MSKTDVATMHCWTKRQRLMRKKARKACKQPKHRYFNPRFALFLKEFKF